MKHFARSGFAPCPWPGDDKTMNPHATLHEDEVDA